MPGERSEQVSPNPSPTVECGVSSQDKPFPGRKPGCNPEVTAGGGDYSYFLLFGLKKKRRGTIRQGP
ncbi:hypothetical protein H671_1g1076 [Cricetulus griseus]|uniref:Uncharacterized protein n=1 Tax=Cricetulus griseus TaxID=10029 RepID=A0A061IRG0_CRIGR|nr:hypothetical protein H671_1g1076 [Cricetulus griseus]